MIAMFGSARAATVNADALTFGVSMHSPHIMLCH